MVRKFTKLLSLMMAVLMVVTSINVPVFAAENESAVMGTNGYTSEVPGGEATLTLGQEYNFAGYKWIAAEQWNGYVVLQASEAVTIGKWPGYTLGRYNGWNTTYDGDIDGDDISYLNDTIANLYESIKEAEKKDVSYGNCLYLISKEKAGYHESTAYSGWFYGSGLYTNALLKAMERSNVGLKGSNRKNAWLGSGKHNLYHAFYVQCDITESENGPGISYSGQATNDFIIAPAFNLDTSKVIVNGDNITIGTASAQFKHSTGIVVSYTETELNGGETINLESLIAEVKYTDGTNKDNSASFKVTSNYGTVSGKNLILPDSEDDHNVTLTVTEQGSGSELSVAKTFNVKANLEKKPAGLPNTGNENAGNENTGSNTGNKKENSVANTEYKQYEENGDCEVYTYIASMFIVTIPKKIVLSGSTKTGSYTVNVKGDIAGDEFVNVLPETSFVMAEKGGKASVTASVSQARTAFAYNDISAENGHSENGTVAAPITAGTWSGKFDFLIGLNLENVIKVTVNDRNNTNLKTTVAMIKGAERRALEEKFTEVYGESEGNSLVVDITPENQDNGKFKVTVDTSQFAVNGDLIEVYHFVNDRWLYLGAFDVNSNSIEFTTDSFSAYKFTVDETSKNSDVVSIKPWLKELKKIAGIDSISAKTANTEEDVVNYIGEYIRKELAKKDVTKSTSFEITSSSFVPAVLGIVSSNKAEAEGQNGIFGNFSVTYVIEGQTDPVTYNYNNVLVNNTAVSDDELAKYIMDNLPNPIGTASKKDYLTDAAQSDKITEEINAYISSITDRNLAFTISNIWGVQPQDGTSYNPSGMNGYVNATLEYKGRRKDTKLTLTPAATISDEDFLDAAEEYIRANAKDIQTDDLTYNGEHILSTRIDSMFYEVNVQESTVDSVDITAAVDGTLTKNPEGVRLPYGKDGSWTSVITLRHGSASRTITVTETITASKVTDKPGIYNTNGTLVKTMDQLVELGLYEIDQYEGHTQIIGTPYFKYRDGGSDFVNSMKNNNYILVIPEGINWVYGDTWTHDFPYDNIQPFSYLTGIVYPTTLQYYSNITLTEETYNGPDHIDCRIKELYFNSIITNNTNAVSNVDSVEYVYYNAPEVFSYMFCGWTGLKKIDFGPYVSTIGYNAFERCTNLNISECMKGSNIQTIMQDALGSTADVNLVIPKSVRFLDSGAIQDGLNGVHKLRSIRFEDGSNITTINAHAFMDVENCTIYIPNTWSCPDDYSRSTLVSANWGSYSNVKITYTGTVPEHANPTLGANYLN